MEMITPDNVTPQLLKEIFDAAYIECELDGEASLAVQGAYRYFLNLDEAKRFIRFVMALRTRNDLSAEACSRYCERVNSEMVVLRLTPVRDNQAVAFDWYVSLAGGVTPKHLVLSSKDYDVLVQDALSRDDGTVF